MINQSHGIPKRPELVVFPQTGIGPFAPKTRLLFQTTDDGWQLVQPRILLPTRIMAISRDAFQLEMQSGMLLNSIAVTGEASDKLLFSKRYSKHLDKLAALISVEQSTEGLEVDLCSDLANA